MPLIRAVTQTGPQVMLFPPMQMNFSLIQQYAVKIVPFQVPINS